MTKVAGSSGTVVFENDGKLFISKLPGQWTAVFLFVVALLTFIFLANGVLQLFVFDSGIVTLGLIFLLVGFVLAFVCFYTYKYRKKINNISLYDLEVICILDLGNDKLLGPNKKVLCSLNELFLSRKMQLGSSSPSLVLKWEKGSLIIVKGSPFAGGISSVENFLLAKGIKKN